MKATDLIEWIETSLKLVSGFRAGQPFKLLTWQRQFLRGAFKRGVYRSALSIARGPGKTSLMGAVASAALAGPLRQARGEVLLVASSLEQARILFQGTVSFLQPTMAKDPSQWRLTDNQQRAILEHRPSGSRVLAVASDPRRAHGKRPSLVLCDEGAQWPVATADKMYAALNTALGKVSDSRLIAVGTRPEDQSHWFQRLLEDADFSMCYAADSDDDPLSEATWVKACPQLKQLPHLHRMVRREAEDARRDPALMAQFRALRCNMGVSDSPILPLCTVEEWQGAEDVYGAAKREGPMYWGLDLGATAAMCGIGSYWPVSGRLEGLGAFPGKPSIEARERGDGVKSGLYQAMVDRGELLVLGNKVVLVHDFLGRAESVFGGRPVRIACDRWRLGELEDALKELGWSEVRIEKRGMGYKDGGTDVRTFKNAFLSGKVLPVPSLLLRSAVGETRLVSDPAGNQKIAKKAEGGRRRGGRDDPAVGSVLAVSMAERVPVPVKPVLVHVPFR